MEKPPMLSQLDSARAEVIARVGVKSFRLVLFGTFKWVYTFRFWRDTELFPKILDWFKLSWDILLSILIVFFPPMVVWMAKSRYDSMDRLANADDIERAKVCLNCVFYDLPNRVCRHPESIKNFRSGVPRNPGDPMCRLAERQGVDSFL